MADDLENVILRTIDRYMASRYTQRNGIVSSYDPDNHAVKVRIQPEDFETGWIPIHAHHVGNGWGLLVGMQPGDQVDVAFQEGDIETGKVMARIHSDQDRPPKVESGEMLWLHQKGQKVFSDKDGNMTVTGSDNNTIVLDKNGGITLTDSAGSTVVLDGSGNIKLTANMVDING